VLRLRNVHPGEVLLEQYLKPFEISHRELARATGMQLSHVRAILGGECRITVDVAMRLAEVLGTGARFWLGLQVDYDLELAQAQGVAGPARKAGGFAKLT
jgi:addiction module HigA family antidote